MKTERIALAVLLTLCIAAPAYAQLIAGPALNASLLYYQPVPASPGTQLDVFVQISNKGDTAHNVRVEFFDNGPFSLASETDRVKELPSVPGNENALLKYSVQVSQNAVPGTGYIQLRYSQGGGQPQTVLLPIDIYSNTVSLNIAEIDLRPDSFVPGGVGNISFSLQNNAPVKVRDGTVTLGLSGLDIVPVGGTNQRRFSDIQAGQSQDFQFSIAPSPDMAPGIYKIPVNISFSDQQGRSYQATEFIGVRVGAKPDVSITVDDAKAAGQQGTWDVVLRVTNKGIGQIKFVDLTMGDSQSYELLAGSPERYIGSIDSDDYKTAQVQLQANAGKVEIPVSVTYMDALNTPYTVNQTLSFPATAPSGGSTGRYVVLGVVVILVVGGYLLVRRRKSR